MNVFQWLYDNRDREWLSHRLRHHKWVLDDVSLLEISSPSSSRLPWWWGQWAGSRVLSAYIYRLGQLSSHGRWICSLDSSFRVVAMALYCIKSNKSWKLCSCSAGRLPWSPNLSHRCLSEGFALESHRQQSVASKLDFMFLSKTLI